MKKHPLKRFLHFFKKILQPKKEETDLGSPVPLGTVLNKSKLTPEDAKFIFDQAEKVLKHTLEDSNTIVSRTTTLITILVTLTAAFFGYFINQLNAASKAHIDWTALIGLLYLFSIIIYTYPNLKPSTYLVTGALPKDLFIDLFFNPAISDKQRIISYYVSEFENYQFKIEKNSEINKKRWRIYKNTLDLLIGIVPLLMVTYILVSSLTS